MSEILSTNFIQNITNFNDIQTVSAYNLNYTLQYKNNGENYNIYNKLITINFLSAAVKDAHITQYTIYYASDFAINNLISEFNWSQNIKYPYIITNNDILNKLSGNLGASSFLTSSQYTELNEKACDISAYCNINNEDFSLNKSFLCEISTVIPSLKHIKDMKLPHQNAEYYISSFYIFPIENFGAYIENTMISAITSSFNNSTYKELKISGYTNNNTTISCIMNNNIISGHYDQTELETLSSPVELDTKYNINTKNEDEKYINCTINVIPVFTNLSAQYYLVNSNNFNTYINLIRNNINYINCCASDVEITNLVNDFAKIDKDSKVTSTDIFTSANYYRINYDILDKNNILDSSLNTKLINSNILHCIYLAPYQLNNEDSENPYTLTFPIIDGFNSQYSINLSSQLLTATGNNDIFDFNFINLTDKKQIISASQISADVFTGNEKLVISTQLINQLDISQILSTETTGYYQYNSTIYNCEPLLPSINNYNNQTYNVFQFLNSSASGILNIACCGSSVPYLSCNFNNKDYINNLSATYFLSTYTGNLTYKPIISGYLYETISTNLTAVPPYSINYTSVGKYFNRIGNNTIYRYTANSSDISNYKLTSFMLSQELPDDIITSFENSNTVFILSSNHFTLSSIYAQLSSMSDLSSYLISSGINDYYFDAYNYYILNNYLSITPKYNIYYNIINNIYIKIPQYFIGSLYTDYTVDTQENIKVAEDTKLLEFEDITVTSSYYKLNISDIITNTSLNISSFYFNPNQYLLLEDTEDSTNAFYSNSITGKVTKFSNCINQNYNFNTNDFTYDSQNNKLLLLTQLFNDNIGTGLIYNTTNIIITGYVTDYIPAVSEELLEKINTYLDSANKAVENVIVCETSSEISTIVSTNTLCGITILQNLSSDIKTISGNTFDFVSDLSTELNPFISIDERNEILYKSLPLTGEYYIAGYGLSTLQTLTKTNNDDINRVINYYLKYDKALTGYQDLNFTHTYLNSNYGLKDMNLTNLYIAYIPSNKSLLSQKLAITTISTIVSSDYYHCDYCHIYNQYGSLHISYNSNLLFKDNIINMYSTIENMINDIPASCISYNYSKITFNSSTNIIDIDISCIPSSVIVTKMPEDMILYFKLKDNTAKFGIYTLQFT